MFVDSGRCYSIRSLAMKKAWNMPPGDLEHGIFRLHEYPNIIMNVRCPMRAMRTILASLFLIVAGLPARAGDTLNPDRLHPGMKGYGLSVFRGTTPERFEVEVLGVLKNALPKQDMILIRMSGADLERHKIIAGMSGSPVYIDGKLIGAVSYGWGFENEPIA